MASNNYICLQGGGEGQVGPKFDMCIYTPLSNGSNIKLYVSMKLFILLWQYNLCKRDYIICEQPLMFPFF